MPLWKSVRVYLSICKPNIVALTLVAALAGIYIGNNGVLPQLSMLIWLMTTLAFATGGACMINNIYDQDIDRKMKRTADRALAKGVAKINSAITLATTMIVVSLLLMAYFVNAASAMVTAVGVFGYAVVYTMWAKRRTPWANQIGGIAGAVPPVIGYVAVTGSLDMIALSLFAIMVVWQQPHALSLALKYREDYAKAGVPVIPVVHGVQNTKLRIFLYAALLVPVSVLPYAVGIAGGLYLAVSVLLGLYYLGMCYKFYVSAKEYDIRIFLFTLLHLIALFGAMMINYIPAH
ncbi:MAG: heme o synthase [Gammaproteobacteria bacterium]|nr:heme o synthase [Gammaproteobacteria bacterium]